MADRLRFASTDRSIATRDLEVAVNAAIALERPPLVKGEPGGSVEHWNAEAGAVWMARLLRRFRNAIWINPRDPRAWDGASPAPHPPDDGGRIYPLTLDGLEAGLKELQRGR